MKLYKILDDNKSTHGGNYTWSLPTKNTDGTWTPGEWTEPIEGNLIACESAYHLADGSQLVNWLGPDIYEAEADEASNDGEKWIARRVRLVRKVEAWNDKTARLFAVWCARKALSLVANPDQRSIIACDVAERYANGDATAAELSAARDAARDAAWAAAWAAARGAQVSKLLELLAETVEP